MKVRYAHVGRKMAWQSLGLLLLAGVMAFSFNQFRAKPLPLVGEWTPQARYVSSSGESLTIPLDEAIQLYYTRKAVFLDARPAELYEQGHIAGAGNLPWEDFDAYFPKVMAGVSPDTKIITYCDGEACALSHDLALALLDKGYKKVNILSNGWTEWFNNQLPIESGVPAGMPKN